MLSTFLQLVDSSDRLGGAQLETSVGTSTYGHAEIHRGKPTPFSWHNLDIKMVY